MCPQWLNRIRWPPYASNCYNAAMVQCQWAWPGKEGEERRSGEGRKDRTHGIELGCYPSIVHTRHGTWKFNRNSYGPKICKELVEYRVTLLAYCEIHVTCPVTEWDKLLYELPFPLNFWAIKKKIGMPGLVKLWIMQSTNMFLPWMLIIAFCSNQCLLQLRNLMLQNFSGD